MIYSTILVLIGAITMLSSPIFFNCHMLIPGAVVFFGGHLIMTFRIMYG